VNNSYFDSDLASIVVIVPVTGGGGGGGGGGGTGGWIDQAYHALQEVVQPPGTVNLLFVTYFLLPNVVWLIAGTVATWLLDLKGIAAALLMILVALLFIGARIA
jgi:hypothetical protein